MDRKTEVNLDRKMPPRNGGGGRQQKHHGSGSGGGGNYQKRRYDDRDNNNRGEPNRDWGDRQRDTSHRGGGNQQGRGGRGGIGGGGRGYERRDSGDRRGGSRGDNMRDRGAPPRDNRGFRPQERQQGGGYGRKPPPQQHSSNPRSRQQGGGGKHTQEQLLEMANTPIPPDQRRTLILRNVPDDVNFKHVQQFFQQNYNALVQFYLLDRNTGDAYVRFKFVEDAKRIWEGGSSSRGSLDGIARGVELTAVHFTNTVMPDGSKGSANDNRGDQRTGGGGRGESGDRKRNWREDDRGGGQFRVKMQRGSEDDRLPIVRMQQQNYATSHTSGKNYYNDDYYDDQYQFDEDGNYIDPTQQKQQHMTSPPAAAAAFSQTPSTNTTNNSYRRTPSKQSQQQKISPIELQLQQQKNEEEQKQWEEFQQKESEWRERRRVEYNAFTEAKNARASQLSTLEQKRDLLTKQEEMLEKQLPLHKKMLTVLQSKEASAADQSKKLKEILSTQTRIVELKAEMKSLVTEIEKMKEDEEVKGVFKPSEKRPIFVGGGSGDGGGGKKRRLDRRTTVLRVEGFDDGVHHVTEDALKEHFSTFGTVASVTFEKDSDNGDSLFASVNFENRLDAERAKSSTAKFNDAALICEWHNTSSSPDTPNDAAETPGNGEGDADANVDDEGLYDDVGDAAYGDEYGEAASPQYNEDSVDYDYGEEEDMVDYD